MNVNLGCGNRRHANAINVDYRETEATDIIHDLREYPWPFEDNQFDNVIAEDIVEHMIEAIPFIDECWRIVKPDGFLYIRTTNFMTEQSYRDLTHYHFCTLNTFDVFDPETTYGSKYNWYSERKWKVCRRGSSGQELIFKLQKRG